MNPKALHPLIPFRVTLQLGSCKAGAESVCGAAKLRSHGFLAGGKRTLTILTLMQCVRCAHTHFVVAIFIRSVLEA